MILRVGPVHQYWCNPQFKKILQWNTDRSWLFTWYLRKGREGKRRKKKEEKQKDKRREKWTERLITSIIDKTGILKKHL